jgi:hypothetical protein
MRLGLVLRSCGVVVWWCCGIVVSLCCGAGCCGVFMSVSGLCLCLCLCLCPCLCLCLCVFVSVFVSMPMSVPVSVPVCVPPSPPLLLGRGYWAHRYWEEGERWIVEWRCNGGVEMEWSDACPALARASKLPPAMPLPSASAHAATTITIASPTSFFSFF